MGGNGILEKFVFDFTVGYSCLVDNVQPEELECVQVCRICLKTVAMGHFTSDTEEHQYIWTSPSLLMLQLNVKYQYKEIKGECEVLDVYIWSCNSFISCAELTFWAKKWRLGLIWAGYKFMPY